MDLLEKQVKVLQGDWTRVEGWQSLSWKWGEGHTSKISSNAKHSKHKLFQISISANQCRITHARIHKDISALENFGNISVS